MTDSTTNTAICPACGCSLIRLGIVASSAPRRNYRDKEYLFCCEGCASLFDEDPVAAIKETHDLIVCPSCLAEKPVQQTVQIEHQGEKISFCRCPHCITAFLEDPDYFLDRLAGKTDFQGIFASGSGCCTSSEPEETGEEGSA